MSASGACLQRDKRFNFFIVRYVNTNRTHNELLISLVSFAAEGELFPGLHALKELDGPLLETLRLKPLLRKTPGDRTAVTYLVSYDRLLQQTLLSNQERQRAQIQNFEFQDKILHVINIVHCTLYLNKC